MLKLLNRLIMFAIVFGVWLVLTWTREQTSVLIGALAALLATLFLGGVFTATLRKLLNPLRWFWFVVYALVLIREMIKANFDVAYRVLHPRLPINPGLVKIRTSLKGEVAKTALANSITLTPGTMTVDINNDELYIHWIDVKARDVEGATRAIAGHFEPLIKKVFD